jgi:hypothetical protein
MTDWMMQSTERDLSEMLGDFLRRKTPSAKDLARLIDCDPRTAEGFRAGRYWPSARHWRLIARAFGRDVLAAVFEPEIDHVLARLTMEERQLEERLNEIRARRRQARGAVEVDTERRDAFDDRPLVDCPPNLDIFEGRH